MTPQVKPITFIITEMTITGNEPIEDMHKFKADHLWRGSDEENPSNTPVMRVPEDKDGFNGIALEPQRIRTFEIKYVPKGPEKQ